MTEETNRRDALVAIGIGAATLAVSTAVASRVAVAREADPIFAEIEHHRALHDGMKEFLKTYSALERLALEAGRNFATDPAIAAHESAQSDRWDVIDAAAERMLATQPTTVIGVLALMRYVADTTFAYGRILPEIERAGCIESFETVTLEHAHRSLTRLLLTGV